MKVSKTDKELAAILKSLKEETGQEKRKIFAVTTYMDEEEDNPRTIFLKKPTRLVRSAGEKLTSIDPYKGVEVFLRGMYLGGDDVEEVIKNDDALTIAGTIVYEIITLKKGGLVIV